MSSTIRCDVAIAGGGLAGSLIALGLKARRPELDVRIVEGGDTLGGHHVWSHFASDVADADRWLVDPLITWRWDGYSVAFPGHARTLDEGYASIDSAQLDRVVRAALPAERVLTGQKVLGASPTRILLANGDAVAAAGVIDARGPGDLNLLQCGWQKFVGRGFRLAAPHGLTRPIIMDATVAQHDGYRFVYVLPLGADEVFVEDTYYSDDPALDRTRLAERIDDYVAAKGWRPVAETRSEAGVLPVTIAGDFEDYWRSGGNRVAKAGMRSGMFQPATGYSLPDAVRLAAAIAAAPAHDGAALHDLTHRLAAAAWRRGGYYRMLNAMLFRAADPQDRYRVIERFYRLGPQLVRRFYAGQSTAWDKARILAGKPPVPVGRAVKTLVGMAR